MNLTQADKAIADGIATAHPIEGKQEKSLVQLWRELTDKERAAATREISDGLRDGGAL